MSTLTKVLIVLLTVSSIFLCGIVATYVANADNYKEMYTSRNTEIQQAKAAQRKANDDYNALKDAVQQEKAALQAEIGALENDIVALNGELRQAQIKRDQLLNDVDQATSALEALEVTNDKWHGMLQNAQTELTKVNAELTKERSQNKEVTTAILEKMAIIAQFQDQTKQLLKEKEQLQAKLVEVLRQFGKTVARPKPVPSTTRDKAQVSPLPPRPAAADANVKEIGLKGLVTQVDLKNSLAVISIGAADGVKEKMRFYVTRGDAFICEILILDVDAERAVGFLERVQTPPKVRDSVSSNIGS